MNGKATRIKLSGPNTKSAVIHLCTFLIVAVVISVAAHQAYFRSLPIYSDAFLITGAFGGFVSGLFAIRPLQVTVIFCLSLEFIIFIIAGTLVHGLIDPSYASFLEGEELVWTPFIFVRVGIPAIFISIIATIVFSWISKHIGLTLR